MAAPRLRCCCRRCRSAGHWCKSCPHINKPRPQQWHAAVVAAGGAPSPGRAPPKGPAADVLRAPALPHATAPGQHGDDIALVQGHCRGRGSRRLARWHWRGLAQAWHSSTARQRVGLTDGGARSVSERCLDREGREIKGQPAAEGPRRPVDHGGRFIRVRFGARFRAHPFQSLWPVAARGGQGPGRA